MTPLKQRSTGRTTERTDLHDDIGGMLAARKNYRQDVLHRVADARYVVFYGCGAIFSSILDTWREYVGRQIDYCCDSDPAKWGRTFCGVTCLSPDQLAEIKEDSVVFVTVGQFRPVFDALRARQFPSVHLIYKYDLVASAFLDEQDPAEVAASLREARSLFADERSRQVFDVILQRILGNSDDIDLMPSICDPDQYFARDVIAFADHEHYVDVGAYDGDTVSRFIATVDGRFDSIHAFELDPANHAHLAANVSGLPQREKIATYNLGAWDSEQEISFSTGKSQSTVGSGEARGKVIPLDIALAGKPVTFIKMDIEGAEIHALSGAARLISAQQPKLAICVYHHFSHLWKIPLLIRKMVPGHTLYLRHYTNLEYETVCYAIPDCRGMNAAEGRTHRSTA